MFSDYSHNKRILPITRIAGRYYSVQLNAVIGCRQRVRSYGFRNAAHYTRFFVRARAFSICTNSFGYATVVSQPSAMTGSRSGRDRL